MRALLRILAPLLGIALAAAGVLVVIEVVAAWVLPETDGGLLVPWPDWLATLASLSWNQSPVPGIAIGVGVTGLLLIIVGLAARRCRTVRARQKYNPCDAGKEQLFALRDHLGVSRNVIVQATCHGADNRAMVDAVRSAGGRARGVATVRPDVSAAELRELDAAGVRGVRFNFVRRLVDAAPTDALATIAAKIAPLGWHVVDLGAQAATSRPAGSIGDQLKFSPL